MLFDLYTNYNLVSGKQYKQKLRPQNSQEKEYDVPVLSTVSAT